MKDIYSDSSLRVLNRILHKNPSLTKFVKEASEVIPPKEDIPVTAFADQANLRFPINSKEMAKLSYCYAVEDRAPDEVLQKISNALELYGERPPDISAGSVPRSSSNYLLPEKGSYPANNEQEVKIACTYFDDYGFQLSSGDRREYCKNLVKTAATFRMKHSDISPYILRYAGVTGTDLKKLAVEIDNRISICDENNKPSMYKTAYIDLGRCLSGYRGPEVYDKPRDFEKVANTLSKLDIESGVDSYYGHFINDPYTSVFNIEKVAERTLKVDGISVPYSKCMTLTKEDYADSFGPEFVRECCDNGEVNPEKLAAVIPTLPLDMKRNFIAKIKNI